MVVKMKNKNKGFSLVELIIVIAIMAILVGVMAPQLIKYIEKTKVASDVQLCDSIHSAMLYAAADPKVVASSDANTQNAIALLTAGKGTSCTLAYFGSHPGSPFYDAVVETLGFDPFISNIKSKGLIKSTPAKDNGMLMFGSANENTFYIWIDHSDISGEKKDIVVNKTSWSGINDVICAPTKIN